MNILFVSHRLPYPPNDGARVRAFHMIQHLAKRGDVTVASLARSAAEYTAGRRLAIYCRRLLIQPISPAAAAIRTVASLGTRTPSSMGYFHSPALQHRINEELATRSYGLIVVHSSSVAPYVKHIQTVPKLLDFVDMDSQKWLAYGQTRPFPLSIGYRLEAAKLQTAEAELSAHFDVCTCITAAELQSLQSYGSARVSGWFPNGVDLDYFNANNNDNDYDCNNICFIGRMDYYPNVQAMSRFCEEVFPIIRRERPDAKLTIVGADPVRAVRKLGKLEGVKVTGTVPDVRPYLQRAAVSIAPMLIARGIQNKILEAMASGVPVVASRLAAAGIDAKPGEHFLVADMPENFAAAVLQMLSAPRRRATLARAARRFVEQNYSWGHAMQQFDKFVETCLDGRRTAASPLGLGKLACFRDERFPGYVP